jgi:hypothetical protein
MDNRLSMDISRQLRQPLATMAADADKCYDRINHIIMLFFLLAMVGTMGPIVAMLHPIQAMKFTSARQEETQPPLWEAEGRITHCKGYAKGMEPHRHAG